MHFGGRELINDIKLWKKKDLGGQGMRVKSKEMGIQKV